MTPRRFLAAIVLLLASAASAAAHDSPYSYLDIAFRDGGIEGTLVVHVIDVAHEIDVEPAERLLDMNVLGPLRHQITTMLAPRLELRNGRRLPLEWTEVVPVEGDHALRMTFRVSGEDPGALAVDANLFPYDPAHQTFVNIYEAGTLQQQMVLHADSGEQTFFRGTQQGVVAVMKTFVPSGIHHILIGPDHILFLVGLLLLGGTWGTLVRIVTAFTVGHSVTLSLAALDLVTPPVIVVEPAIALSIVFVGADNLVRGDGGTGRDVRAWVALLFGLVHGFGFANVLREFGLPPAALGWSLFSFNVGVEIGQLAVVLIVASILAAVRQRSRRVAHGVAVAGSVVVIAAGAYWFVERVFFPGLR